MAKLDLDEVIVPRRFDGLPGFLVEVERENGSEVASLALKGKSFLDNYDPERK